MPGGQTVGTEVELAVGVRELVGVAVSAVVAVAVGVKLGGGVPVGVRVFVAVSVGVALTGGGEPVCSCAMNVPQSPVALDALYSPATQIDPSEGSTAAPE